MREGRDGDFEIVWLWGMGFGHPPDSGFLGADFFHVHRVGTVKAGVVYAVAASFLAVDQRGQTVSP